MQTYMNTQQSTVEDMEEYFYLYFSIPEYDKLDSPMDKKEWLEKYKSIVSHLSEQKAREDERQVTKHYKNMNNQPEQLNEIEIEGVKFQTGKTLECDTPACREYVRLANSEQLNTEECSTCKKSLQAERNRIIEIIEKMERKAIKNFDTSYYVESVNGYNQALSDIINEIKVVSEDNKANV